MAWTSRPARHGHTGWRGATDFCAKLLRLPMGCDICYTNHCYTNHAEADQDDMDALLTLLGAAGVTYIVGVPGAEDVMLHYQRLKRHRWRMAVLAFSARRKGVLALNRIWSMRRDAR